MLTTFPVSPHAPLLLCMGVSLSPAEAIAIASDLLNAALPQLAALRATVEEELDLVEEQADD